MSRVDHTIALVDDRNTRPFSIQIETCEMPSIDIQNLIAAPESHSKRFWPPSRHDTYFLVSYRAASAPISICGKDTGNQCLGINVAKCGTL